MSISLWSEKNRTFFLIHLVVTGVCCIAATPLGSMEKTSFYLGQLYFWLSLLALSISVQFFLLKKNIALFIVAIVLKWPVLIYIIYQTTNIVKIHPFYLSAGIFPLIMSALFWSLMVKKRRGNHAL